MNDDNQNKIHKQIHKILFLLLILYPLKLLQEKILFQE